MRLDTRTLDVPATQTQGAAADVSTFTDKSVQISGIAGGATVRVQGRIGSLPFAPLGTSITADGVYSFPESVTEMRVDRTAVGTGNPVVSAVLGGRFAG